MSDLDLDAIERLRVRAHSADSHDAVELLVVALREARERAAAAEMRITEFAVRTENELRRLVGWKFREGPNA